MFPYQTCGAADDGQRQLPPTPAIWLRRDNREKFEDKGALRPQPVMTRSHFTKWAIFFIAVAAALAYCGMWAYTGKP